MNCADRLTERKYSLTNVILFRQNVKDFNYHLCMKNGTYKLARLENIFYPAIDKQDEILNIN